MYVGTNRLVARLPNLRTFTFSWERHIPLVPVFILPYWSTDFLYLCGPLLCTSRTEVRTFAKRLIFAFVVGCICFVLFPMRLAFPRPEVFGTFAWLFHLMYWWDRPVNMVPSLHVTEVALLWVIYVRHTGGILRRLLQLWMLLIVASTLLVWQHHVIDVIGGALLAAVCFWLFPERTNPRGLASSTENKPIQ